MMYHEEEAGYNGNPLLKKSGTAIEWDEFKLKEIEKCRNDIIYFCENYIKIINVDRGFITIDLYDYQKDIIREFYDNRNLAANLSRQSGKTTTAVCIILHYIIFNSHKLVAILANKAATANEILKRIKDAYEALPAWLQQGIKRWGGTSIELENKTVVKSAATSSSAIRGQSVNLLYIDETAHVPNWLDFSASVLPTISSGDTTKILYTSTPLGLNHWYKICTDAREKRSNFGFVEVKWNDVPRRDEAWRQRALAELEFDEERFAQEYEVEFVGSSGTLISGAVLKSLVHQIPLASRNGLYQYELPKENRSYCIVADVSRGKGLDYSAFHVIDVTEMPYKQVCVYRNNMITPVDYAGIIHSISKLYNQAMILVEINDIGEQVSVTLYNDYESENLLYTESHGRAGKKISTGFGGNVDKGLRTTKSTKAVGCSILKLLVEQRQLIINDANTIEEISRFSRKGSSYEAEPGSHDDLVMGLVIFAWLSNQTYFRNLTDINTLQHLRDKTNQEIEDDLLPFGFMDVGGGDEDDSIIDLTKTFIPEFANF